MENSRVRQDYYSPSFIKIKMKMMVSEIELNKLIKKAVKILRKNYGCPGSDGISYKMIKEEPSLHYSIITKKIMEIVFGEGQFSFPREVKIIDYFKHERIIYVYNIYDRIVQECIKLNIQQKCNSFLSENVLSYKRGINVAQRKECFINESKVHADDILEFDIKHFFMSIDKDILYRKLEEINVSNCIINLIKKSFSHCKDGIPTGHCLSPLLSNLYLSQVDTIIDKPFLRYCDDFIVNLKGEDALIFIENIKRALREINLEINLTKIRLNNNPLIYHVN